MLSMPFQLAARKCSVPQQDPLAKTLSAASCGQPLTR
jgi:hypothetical protein